MLCGSICIKQYKLMKEHNCFEFRGMIVLQYFLSVHKIVHNLAVLFDHSNKGRSLLQAKSKEKKL